MIEYLKSNYVILFELIGLLILVFISAHFEKNRKKYTILTIILLLITNIFYYLETWTQTFETLSIMRPMFASAVYSLYPFIILLLIKVINSDVINKKIWNILIWIPAVVSVPLYFTSQWTGIVFQYTEDNRYQGGPLSRLSYIVFAFYLVIFLVLNFAYFRKYTLKIRGIMTYIILVPVIGVILYVIFDYQDSYISLFTTAIIIYYLFIYIHNSSVDPLTGLFNRQIYYQDMKSVFRRIDAVSSIDMNELKFLNDTYGHAKGDEALKVIAEVLRTNCGRGASVYRVGGDEFMIFYYDVTEDEVKQNIENMRNAMDKTEYTCAFGYAMRKDENIETTILESDKQMYDDKSRIKKEILEQGGKLHRRKDD